ncbi:DUF397 domain-containing protein [Streptomyces kanamyceticus]|uniref:DUF397 domain-containing protein n=1 Tax=Streptomyces kanamyceticus TaxID=1967 RepID=A0A5J6GK59_STRKN|nr:DUF397 domain-containing protein [Streptomyces kanamyceticus]QEU94481.1 DUF397 domain-containing protein [Streptomyces kanamyceticus]
MREYALSSARWRKSSYSSGDGGENCVEVAYDFIGAARWRKSTYSSGDESDNCVEVADGVPGVVPVRDSKTAPEGPALLIGAAAWSAFVAYTKR